MPNGRNEAECWNCLHFVSIGRKKCCSLHKVVLPTGLGPYLICQAWNDEAHSSSALTQWRQGYLHLIEKNMLNG